MPLSSVRRRPRARNWTGIIACAATAALALGSYLFVYHSHYYHSTLGSWAIGLLIVGWSTLIVLWTAGKRRLVSFIKACAALAVFMGWFASLSHLNTAYLSRQRTEDGVSGWAQVVDFEREVRRNSTTSYVVLAYGPTGEAGYRQRKVNTWGLHFGDSLRVVYSAANPENVAVTQVRRLTSF